MHHKSKDFVDLMKNEDLPLINLRIYVRMIQNVWNIQNIERNKKQIEDEVTDHKYHSHIQMGNSHWQLRLSHHPLTQHSSWPLWLIPINIEQCEYHNSIRNLHAGFKNSWVKLVIKCIEMLNKYDLDLQNNFHLSGTVWFMNVQY